MIKRISDLLTEINNNSFENLPERIKVENIAYIKNSTRGIYKRDNPYSDITLFEDLENYEYTNENEMMNIPVETI